MSASKKVKAPWTAEQVKSLNGFQTESGMHPFTCGNNRTDAAHLAYAEQHGGDWGELVATPKGWVCPAPGCDYTQDWADEYMTSGRWRESSSARLFRGEWPPAGGPASPDGSDNS
jgi:hypothetical protein